MTIPTGPGAISKKTHDITMGCMIDLSYLGLLKIEGADAAKLLQGQLTCHIDEIIHQKTGLGAHCNPQGRVISFFRIFYLQDHFYLQMPRALVPIALAALKKYAVFFKVTLTDISQGWGQLGIEGEADRLVRQLIEDNGDLHAISLPGRTLLLGERALIENLQKNLQTSLQLVDETRWQLLDLRAEVPSIYPETHEKFLPHELQLPQLNAVSFNKGCYTGQEIIARMHYRGKLKSRLYRALVEMPLPPECGADIYSADKVVGTLVNFVKIGPHTFELLLISQQADALFMAPSKHCPLVLYR